ncbi:hypothetical protein HDV02_002168 [Globomyces sp. JEL0801]|nr:hypothetical protein HDV02_002168 [Globomyces sp. JEL0801]
MKLPENKKCADCRKKDPRWASWNLGIFVCIQCSGIHRSIGTHISKGSLICTHCLVKSADLDTWTPEQIENMIKWGNHKAQLYWEHDWPKDMAPPESNLEQYIRAKYERKQYAMKGPMPDPATLGEKQSVSNTPSTNTNATVQTFNAFQSGPVASGIASVQAKSTVSTTQSATQQLFDAFQTAPPPNVLEDRNKSILSLYGNPPTSQFAQSGGVTPQASTVQPKMNPPQQSDFGNFASFSSSGVNSGSTNAPTQLPASSGFGNFPATSPAKPGFGNFSASTPANQSGFNGFTNPSAQSTAQPFGNFSSNSTATQPTTQAFGNFSSNSNGNSNLLDGLDFGAVPSTAQAQSYGAMNVNPGIQPTKKDPFGDIGVFGASTTKQTPVSVPPNFQDDWSNFQ